MKITRRANPRPKTTNTHAQVRRVSENANKSRRPSSIGQSSGFVISDAATKQRSTRNKAKGQGAGAGRLHPSPRTPVSVASVLARRHPGFFWLSAQEFVRALEREAFE